MFTASALILFVFPPNFCFTWTKRGQWFPDLSPEGKSLADARPRSDTSKAVTSSLTPAPIYILCAVTNPWQGHQVLPGSCPAAGFEPVRLFPDLCHTHRYILPQTSFYLRESNAVTVAGQGLGWWKAGKGFWPVIRDSGGKQTNRKGWKQSTWLYCNRSVI